MKKENFTIPIAGLKEKVYHFHYDLEDSFFDTVEQPLVEKSNISVDLTFDKTNEPFVLDFEISGTYEDECDRCATNIKIPITGDFRLFVELGSIDHEDKTEVIYLSRDDHEIKLFDHIYDFVNLSIPMVKRCESPEDLKLCDAKVESFMKKNNSVEESKSDPRWEALNKLKN